MLYRFLRNDAWLSLPQIGSVLKGKVYIVSISHMNNSTPHLLRTVPTFFIAHTFCGFYSGFLSVMLTNSGIFLHSLKLTEESRS